MVLVTLLHFCIRSPPREGRHKHRRSSRRHKTYSSSPSGSSYSRSASRSESRSPKHHKRRAAAHAGKYSSAASSAAMNMGHLDGGKPMCDICMTSLPLCCTSCRLVGFARADNAGPDQGTVAELATAKARVAELETRIAALESQAAVQSRARSDMTDQLADLNVAQQVR